jgi:hypothetical protein
MCLHVSMLVCAQYNFTSFHDHIKPTQIFIHIRPCTHYTDAHHIRTIQICIILRPHVYIHLCPYIYTHKYFKFYTSYILVYTLLCLLAIGVYAHIRPINMYILLRPYSYASLHTCTLIYLYMITYLYAIIPIMFTYFHAYISIHIYVLLRLFTCLRTSTFTYFTSIYTL